MKTNIFYLNKVTLMIPPLKLGTRGSPLALAQAAMVARLLAVPSEIVVLKTSGDLIQDRPLSEVGGKGLFTKELDDALQAGHIDMAVHCIKDMASVLASGTTLAAILPREDYHDRLIVPGGSTYCSVAELPAGARIGTSSLRRAAQIRHRRPDLIIVPFRGNVGTRLAKLAAGEADATILAAAGLNRLGKGDLGCGIDIDLMLPAPAQGAIGIACRLDDRAMQAQLAPLNDLETADCIAVERAFLAELDGSCRTPIAALARFNTNDDIELIGEILSVDGTRAVRRQTVSDPSSALDMARAMAREIKSAADPDMLAAFD